MCLVLGNLHWPTLHYMLQRGSWIIGGVWDYCQIMLLSWFLSKGWWLHRYLGWYYITMATRTVEPSEWALHHTPILIIGTCTGMIHEWIQFPGSRSVAYIVCAGIYLAFIYDGWVGNWARVGYVNHGSYNVSYAHQNSIVYNQFMNDS